MARQRKNKGDQEDDPLSIGHSRVEILLIAFDILDTTLLHAIEMFRLKMSGLSYQRDSPASAKAVYRLYLETTLSEQPTFLGSVEMRKMQPEATEAVIRRVATGAKALPFEEIVKRWKEYIDFDREISKAAVERSKKASEEDTGDDIKRGGTPGRPHLPDDVWAWQQVNRHNRPRHEVYKEWLQKIKADPHRCNMVDPERQFNRIIKPEWGNKSEQNI